MVAYTPVQEWGWTFLVSTHRGDWSSLPNASGAFRLHWVVEGTEAPRLFFEGSRSHIQPPPHARFRTVVFHPGALNDAFLEGDVYDLDAFQGTTKSDQYYLHPFLQAGSGVTPSLAAVDRLQTLFDRMDDELRDRRDGFWPCRTRSLLLEALILARGLEAAPETGFVDRVLGHLHTHFAEPLTLPGLASLFATNRTTLSQRFRERTGVSVGEYLRTHRLTVAGVLLRDTTLPVQEIMERVGFSDPSQFGRLFRRAMGASPSEYRQRNNWLLRPAS